MIISNHRIIFTDLKQWFTGSWYYPEEDKFQLYFCEELVIHISTTFILCNKKTTYTHFNIFEDRIYVCSIDNILKHDVSNCSILVFAPLSFINTNWLLFYFGYCCHFQTDFLHTSLMCKNKWVWSNVKCICQMNETKCNNIINPQASHVYCCQMSPC